MQSGCPGQSMRVVILLIIPSLPRGDSCSHGHENSHQDNASCVWGRARPPVFTSHDPQQSLKPWVATDVQAEAEAGFVPVRRASQ
ncbi:hypothetical protein V8C26DRAFT_383688 [Trichoderma gracile]